MSPRSSAPPPSPRVIAQEFVETSGFPLEVRATDAFRQAGFTSLSSLVYDNPATGDVGEIDNFAFREASIPGEDPGASFQISYVVECKRSADVPWLLFRSQPGGVLATPFLRSVTLLQSRGVGSLLFAHAGDWKDRLRLTAEMPGVAYRVRAARTGEDVAFKAVSGAVRAARAQVESTSRQHEAAKRERTRLPFEISRPVVVVSAPLFFCDFEPSGQFTLEETERGSVLTTSTAPTLPRSVLVDVVTEAGLASYAAEQNLIASELLDALNAPLRRAADLAAREYELRDQRDAASSISVDRPRS